MRFLGFVCLLTAAASASAGTNGSLKHQVVIDYEKFAGGFYPAAVVRPDGDTVVEKLPTASGLTTLTLRSELGALRSEVQPFMIDAPGHTGPSAVGLQYSFAVAPFNCRDRRDAAFDPPWSEPCLEFGFQHRSEHNIDDGLYGGTYTNSLLLRLRLVSARQGASALWLSGQWALESLETPFAFTPSTSIPAGDLERRLWQAGLSGSLAIGASGKLTGGGEMRAAAAGPAAVSARLRYLHAFSVSLTAGSDGSGSAAAGPSLSLALGAELGLDLNLRKQEQLGGSAARFGLLLALPIGI